MFRPLFNQQLGLHNSEDKKIQIMFFSRQFDNLIDHINYSDSDFQENLATCERSLAKLHELNAGVDVKFRANKIIHWYLSAGNIPARLKLVPKRDEKILHAQYYYLEAFSDPNAAYEVLQMQDLKEMCFFTEAQMLALDRLVHERTVVFANVRRVFSISCMQNFYIRLALTKPDIMKNYAAYLIRHVESDVEGRLAQDLNTFMMNGIIARESFNHSIFRACRIVKNGNEVYISLDDTLISIHEFLAMLKSNATLFAYKDYQIKCNLWDENSPALIPRRRHLINCINELIVFNRPVTSPTKNVLEQLIESGDEVLAHLANTALRTCPLESAISVAESAETHNRMTSPGR